MEQQNTTDIAGRIAELRQRFARLKATCGLQAISKETINEYVQEINNLNQQMKGGEER